MVRETWQGKVSAVAVNRKERQRFVKFAVVGAIGAVVDLIVLNLLVQLGGLPELVANPISVGAAILSNFTWNRLWSFPESRQRPLLPQLGQFVAVNLTGLVINTVIFGLVLHWVTPQLGLRDPLDYNFAKLFAIGVVLFWNFGVNRVTTYRGL